jgi:hypothetical protein
MRGVSGPSSRNPAAWMEHGLPLLLHCAEQLHVHVPPHSWGIEIESTPSAVGILVGEAVVGDVAGKQKHEHPLREPRLCLRAHSTLDPPEAP